MSSHYSKVIDHFNNNEPLSLSVDDYNIILPCNDKSFYNDYMNLLLHSIINSKSDLCKIIFNRLLPPIYDKHMLQCIISNNSYLFKFMYEFYNDHNYDNELKEFCCKYKNYDLFIYLGGNPLHYYYNVCYFTLPTFNNLLSFSDSIDI